jgi:transcriptional regulator with XRE-family HTH domain
MLDQHFPNRLRYMRILNRMTQKQVAALIGKRDRTSLSRYERGNAIPTLEVAAKFEIIYNTHVSDIFPALFSSARAEVDTARRPQIPRRHRQSR